MAATPPPSASGDVLRDYLRLLRGTLLAPATRERVARRERLGEFPFSVHNIYQVLTALEPVLADGWSAVAERRPLTSADPLLGTSLQCFRHLHVLLLAAGDPPCPRPFHEAIAARAVRMTDAPICFCAQPPPDVSPPTDPDTTLRLTSTLRQYADVNWLGQHDQAFVGSPPVRGPAGEIAYARCFGRLPARIGHTSLHVTVTYDVADDLPVEFDVFRGEAVTPLPRHAVKHCAIQDSGVPVTGDRCREMLSAARDALRGARRAVPPDVVRGNHAVADIFMGTLLAEGRAADIDVEPWRTRAHARLCEERPPSPPTMTERFLDRLEAATRRWDTFLSERKSE